MYIFMKTGPQVLIRGENTVIVVKVYGPISSDKFYGMIALLKERDFIYDPRKKEWIKYSNNLDEDMNELENYLMENNISFVNIHPNFTVVPEEILDKYRR